MHRTISVGKRSRTKVMLSIEDGRESKDSKKRKKNDKAWSTEQCLESRRFFWRISLRWACFGRIRIIRKHCTRMCEENKNWLRELRRGGYGNDPHQGRRRRWGGYVKIWHVLTSIGFGTSNQLLNLVIPISVLSRIGRRERSSWSKANLIGLKDVDYVIDRREIPTNL